MNKQRRKLIEQASQLIYEAKSLYDVANGKVEEANAFIQEAKDEEQASFDNLPEGLQGSSRGAEMEEWVDNLQEIEDYLDNFLQNGLVDLEEADRCLDNLI